MARGRRSAPGRRSGVGADSGTGGDDDDDEDTGRGDIDDPDTAGFDDVTEDDDPGPTSSEDLASVADPGEFDETFTDDDAPLSIAGNFDPSAGPKQVIPRIAFVLNYNLIYNAERDRWEPQKKSETGGAYTEAATGTVSLTGNETTRVSTGVTDRGIAARSEMEIVSLDPTETEVSMMQDGIPGNSLEVYSNPLYVVSSGEWEVYIEAAFGNGPVELRWYLLDGGST